MGQLLDLQEARRRLGLAVEVLSHDRWVVGLLRGGALQPVAASEISRRLLQARPLQPLSRRALFEQRPVVVNSVFPYTTPAAGFDWELDWPAIMYAPIGQPEERPIGLLVLGCRRDYWYSEEDVQYAIGLSAAPWLHKCVQHRLDMLELCHGETNRRDRGIGCRFNPTHSQAVQIDFDQIVNGKQVDPPLLPGDMV